ncbi:MAG TPA: AbrB/MazE/SpoVT family DNA-binding domain-containing protein [Chloroflexota bacterium]
MSRARSAASAFRVPVGAKGRIVLPLEVRERLGVREGDHVLVELTEDGSARLTSLEARARDAIGMYAHLAPGVSLADELSAERRRDAERE